VKDLTVTIKLSINKWIKLKYFKNSECPFTERAERASANEFLSVIDLIGSIFSSRYGTFNFNLAFISDREEIAANCGVHIVNVRSALRLFSLYFLLSFFLFVPRFLVLKFAARI